MTLNVAPSSSSLISQRVSLSFSLPASAFDVVKNTNDFSVVRFPKRGVRRGGQLVALASNEASNRPVLDVVFEPFEEVKKELLLVPTVPQASLARQKYSDKCEAAINDQIKWVSLSHSLSYIFTFKSYQISYWIFFFFAKFLEKKGLIWDHFIIITMHNSAYVSNADLCSLDQCGIQRLLCVSCHVCLLRQRQCCSQGICQVRKLCNPRIFLILFWMLEFFRLICWLIAWRFFKDSSIEERNHAEKLMDYQVFAHWLSLYA